MRYFYMPIRISVIQNTDNTNVARMRNNNNYGKGKTIEKIKRFVIYRGLKVRKEEWKRWITRDCQGSKISLYDIVMVCTRHYASVKTPRMYNRKSISLYKDRLQLIIY